MRPQDVENLSTPALDWESLWDETEQRYLVQTRDGRKVRIFVTDAREQGKPIVGEIREGVGVWALHTWSSNGQWRIADRGKDLIPEPRTVCMWVNIYKRANGTYSTGNPWNSEATAHCTKIDPNVNRHYIATVPVEWEE